MVSACIMPDDMISVIKAFDTVGHVTLTDKSTDSERRKWPLKHWVWSLLSFKHLVGRLFGVDQCNVVRRVQCVSGVHSEKPEQSRVPRHGGSVWLHHRLHSDVSWYVYHLSILRVWLILTAICCCVCWWRAMLEHKAVASIQWSWQVGE